MSSKGDEKLSSPVNVVKSAPSQFPFLFSSFPTSSFERPGQYALAVVVNAVSNSVASSNPSRSSLESKVSGAVLAVKIAPSGLISPRSDSILIPPTVDEPFWNVSIPIPLTELRSSSILAGVRVESPI